MTRVEPGDCIEVMRKLVAEGVRFDAIVTDPPYHFGSIVERWTSASKEGVGAYGRHAKGFMGREWDGGDIAFQARTWQLALMLLKPGGHLLAFGGTRGYHRLACAIEDAGAEIRDTIAWLYGSGFPKSHNQTGEWEGWGTALKPAMELIAVAQRPFEGSVKANLGRQGVGALNIDGCRVGYASDVDREVAHKNALGPVERAKSFKMIFEGGRKSAGFADTHSAMGRWPANVCHDGGEEVTEAFAAFGDSKGAAAPVTKRGADKFCTTYGAFTGQEEAGATFHGDTGTAARFYYCAKATTAERVYRCPTCGAHTMGKPGCGHKDLISHPTVKPIALMRWLTRLVTPPGGLILDPFAGTGTTAQAALAEGFRAVLIEREADHLADIAIRLNHLEHRT